MTNHHDRKRRGTPAAKNALPPGHELMHTLKTTAALRPGDSVRIPAHYPVAGWPITIPNKKVCVPLAWDRLAIIAPADATWEARTIQPSVWTFRACTHCKGTGRA
jgi:hypothetical protein